MVLAIADTKALWYLTRGTGVVALLLLTAVMLLGIASTFRWRSPRSPRFVVAHLHRNLTLLSIVFVVVHVVTTVADGYAPVGLVDAVIPFRSAYRPVWLGLGALSFDLLLALVVTSLLRVRLGHRAWRLLHWSAYAAWPLAVAHGLGTGSDSSFGWAAALTIGCIAAVALASAVPVARAALRTPPRIAAAVGTLAVSLLILGWYRTGPLSTGWAARAGTPATLLASRRASSSAGTAAAHPAVRAAFVVPFSGRLDARIARSSDAAGNIGVAIAGNVRGSGVAAVLHLILWGVSTAQGGVAMSTSSVTFSPVGAKGYSGRVVSLNGDQVVADLTGNSGTKLRLSLALQTDAQTSVVTGLVQGGSA